MLSNNILLISNLHFKTPNTKTLHTLPSPPNPKLHPKPHTKTPAQCITQLRNLQQPSPQLSKHSIPAIPHILHRRPAITQSSLSQPESRCIDARPRFRTFCRSLETGRRRLKFRRGSQPPREPSKPAAERAQWSWGPQPRAPASPNPRRTLGIQAGRRCVHTRAAFLPSNPRRSIADTCRYRRDAGRFARADFYFEPRIWPAGLGESYTDNRICSGGRKMRFCLVKNHFFFGIEIERM